ncbi:MAG: RluA family pseudouridine synthase [Syntrophales bacterium]
MSGDPRTERCTVAGGDEDVRLDVYLAGRDVGLSRSQIRKAVEEGRVLVDGRRVKAGYRLRAGETVELAIPEAAPSSVQAEDIPLSIAFEDEHLLVVDKPAGMVVHPAAGHSRGTLVHALLHHCRDLSGIGGVLRPGIVHRLDRDTSGLLLVAKTDEAHRGLTTQFRDRRIDKTYLALVLGTPRTETGEILLPVGRHPADRKKMSTRSSRGREAVTRWRVRERFGSVTLLEVDLLTGRTHQIRVHLSSQGHPVVGDAVYGRSGLLKSVTDTETRSILRGVKRQALHAARIAFRHPVHGTFLSFQSPLPEDMAGLCEALRGRRTYV